MNSDFVYFLAFDVGGSRYLKRYQKTFDFMINNLLIMSNVFRLLKNIKKFIFASSQMSNMDFSPYGTLKRLGEEVTKSLNAVYVKFWNVYGVENDIEKSHVVTDFCFKSIKKKHINMLTDGKESREFLFADDCSEGLFIIMNKFKFFSKKTKNYISQLENGLRLLRLQKLFKNYCYKEI